MLYLQCKMLLLQINLFIYHYGTLSSSMHKNNLRPNKFLKYHHSENWNFQCTSPHYEII